MGTCRVDDCKQCTQLRITQKDPGIEDVGMILKPTGGRPLPSVGSYGSINDSSSVHAMTPSMELAVFLHAISR
jgi:hypothetical protein